MVSFRIATAEATALKPKKAKKKTTSTVLSFEDEEQASELEAIMLLDNCISPDLLLCTYLTVIHAPSLHRIRKTHSRSKRKQPAGDSLSAKDRTTHSWISPPSPAVQPWVALRHIAKRRWMNSGKRPCPQLPPADLMEAAKILSRKPLTCLMEV